MNNNTHPFQKWIDDNGIVDVRFYPKNPSESSATSLLDGAMLAVKHYEDGNFVEYTDDTPEVECESAQHTQ